MYLSSSTATISGASFTSCYVVSETERPATTHYALRQLVRPSARIRTTSSFTTIDGDCCTCAQPSKPRFDPLTTIARLPPLNIHLSPDISFDALRIRERNASIRPLMSHVPSHCCQWFRGDCHHDRFDHPYYDPLPLLRCAGIGYDWDRIGSDGRPRCVTGIYGTAVDGGRAIPSCSLLSHRSS